MQIIKLYIYFTLNILNRCLIHTLMIYIFLTEFSEFLHILNGIFKILKMKKIDFSFFALNFSRKNENFRFSLYTILQREKIIKKRNSVLTLKCIKGHANFRTFRNQGHKIGSAKKQTLTFFHITSFNAIQICG